ncbi:MAG: Serine/threonine-protein kinase PknD [Chlamydiales bacterium]|nr:Serine/threonine-protein kinase PknD [Chlamydiales bacterium]MCH9619670.1 Serine/threonine-protein kinase PknD [Chlamydiales bacterium]MCH9623276.1 Serine/threonine-protein kinase PknD [Chlamydiales bacterium]
MSVSSQSNLPDEIGGYPIEALLSKGGMSLLYLALHPKTKEPIVVKVLSPKSLSNQKLVDHFLNEAKLIEVTDHPNIIQLYGYGKWEGGVYIAMEFVQGIDLRQMILQQAISLKRSLEIALQVSHAIAHLHAHGIIHRDLKPENVLLTAQGGIKVIDFGIAQLYSQKLKQEQLLGTPSYMSPEQREDIEQVSFQSDIFSLGVIVYEMILGRLCHGTIQLSQVPRGMQKVLAKALQPDPKKRYGDIVDFIHALSNYLNSDALKKDMRGSDYMGELNEEIKGAQSLLIPHTLPHWKRVEMGLVSNSNMAISAVYYDFFENREGVYTVVMGESLATGVRGLLEISTLRGMIHALKEIEEGSEFVATLNNRLIELEIESPYAFSFLSLIPSEDRFSFISCGYTPLWITPSEATPRRLTSNNTALGIHRDAEFLEVDSNWAVGDSVVLHTFQASLAKDVEEVQKNETIFANSLKENRDLKPQNQVDTLFRQVCQKEGRPLFDKLVTIISMERLS